MYVPIPLSQSGRPVAFSVFSPPVFVWLCGCGGDGDEG